MTAQINDSVIHSKTNWALAGANGGPLFDPAAHGLGVRPASSACWRGFVCTYEIRDWALLLVDMKVSLNGPAPRLLNTDPEQLRNMWFTASYRDLNYPIPFTGSILLARDFIRGRYAHRGFAPGWKYERVLEVELEGGRVSSVTDCSDDMAAIRQRVAGAGQPGVRNSEAEVMNWIERAFSRRH